MGSGKQGSSENSSEENDRQEQVKEDSTITVTAASKRSYECTFCKRGFTNAQALGGHMNIHRKDRAKSKQVMTSSSNSAKPTEDYLINPNFMGPISSKPLNYYPVLDAHKNYPPVYFQLSEPSSPRQQLPRGNNYYHGVQRHPSLNMNEELWGANLSLQIGSNHIENNIELHGDVPKEDELDLELRLGHDPY